MDYKRSLSIGTCFLFVALSFTFLGTTLNSTSLESDGTTVSDGIKVGPDSVEISVYDSEGNLKFNERVYNLVTQQGENFTADCISGTSSSGAGCGGDNITKYISLADDEAEPLATWMVLPNEIITGDAVGLERATGTVATMTDNGNFTVSNTFSVTGTIADVNVTGLNWNATEDGRSLFAAASFSGVNLESGDSLKINWSVNVNTA